MEYICDPNRQTNQSSLRLLQILECLAKNRGALRLQEIAKLTELTQPTVLRYLYALEAANYVYQEEDSSRYALTWKVCRLTQNMNSYLSLRNITSGFIVEQAYDPVYGARPLKRYIQKYVETLSAKLILADKVEPGDVIRILLENEQLKAVAQKEEL